MSIGEIIGLSILIFVLTGGIIMLVDYIIIEIERDRND
jgi:hypothetical protein